MIRIIRIAFAISHISYSPRTIPLIEKFSKPSPKLSLLNFNNAVPHMPFFSKLFKPKKHSELLELYLNYIEKRQESPQGIAYQAIELNLRQAIINELQKKRLQVKVEEFKVIQSELMQETEFRGVFIHRNLNLSSSSYDIKPYNKQSAIFEFKKSLRKDGVQEYERIIRNYNKQKMDEIYCCGYDQFQKERVIKRSIYRMEANIQLSLQGQGVKQKVGGKPTEHILQIQSVFNRYYNMEEYFLTDVDFVLKGNYFLRGKTQ